MKKTITKQDGSVEVVEGTPEEIAELERRIKGEVQNEAPKKGPGLLTDELKRMLDGWKSPGGFRPSIHAHECEISVAERGTWLCIFPPHCTCGATFTTCSTDITKYKFT